jgi:hypothetical protein
MVHLHYLHNLFKCPIYGVHSSTNNYWGEDPPQSNGIVGQVIYDPWKATPIEEAGPG